MPRALLVGASGLVGRECLRLLLDDPAYERVAVLARRDAPPDVAGRAKLDWRVVDFERLGDSPPGPVDHVFCALGTTMKQAGTRARFYRVDHDYPVEVGRLALAAGARHYALVSAAGADVRSRFYYNRVKGEAERDVAALGFPGVTIVRPSLLLGDRAERRAGEEIGKRLGFLVPRRWKPIEGRKVAAAMVRAAKEGRAGVRIIGSGEMQ